MAFRRIIIYDSPKACFLAPQRGNYARRSSDGRDVVRHPSRHVSRGGEERPTESRMATLLNVRGGMEDKIEEVCQMMGERRIDVLCETERNISPIQHIGQVFQRPAVYVRGLVLSLRLE